MLVSKVLKYTASLLFCHSPHTHRLVLSQYFGDGIQKCYYNRYFGSAEHSEDLHSFQPIDKNWVLLNSSPDSSGSMRLTYYHKPSGVVYAHIATDSPSHFGSFSFRTGSFNAKGLPHILEHAVLRGSIKYNTPNMYRSLERRTVATVLNARTTADRTMFAFSTSYKLDFLRLSRLHLDTLLFPRLSLETFDEEAFKYVVNDPKDPQTTLSIAGNVYNEVKGLSTQSNQYVSTSLYSQLYPLRPHGHPYGGDPRELPLVTVEELRRFHSEHYTPSNMLVCTSGDLDINEYLSLLSSSITEYSELHGCFPVAPAPYDVLSDSQLDNPERFMKDDSNGPDAHPLLLRVPASDWRQLLDFERLSGRPVLTENTFYKAWSSSRTVLSRGDLALLGALFNALFHGSQGASPWKSLLRAAAKTLPHSLYSSKLSNDRKPHSLLPSTSSIHPIVSEILETSPPFLSGLHVDAPAPTLVLGVSGVGLRIPRNLQPGNEGGSSTDDDTGMALAARLLDAAVQLLQQPVHVRTLAPYVSVALARSEMAAAGEEPSTRYMIALDTLGAIWAKHYLNASYVSEGNSNSSSDECFAGLSEISETMESAWANSDRLAAVREALEIWTGRSALQAVETASSAPQGYVSDATDAAPLHGFSSSGESVLKWSDDGVAYLCALVRRAFAAPPEEGLGSAEEAEHCSLSAAVLAVPSPALMMELELAEAEFCASERSRRLTAHQDARIPPLSNKDEQEYPLYASKCRLPIASFEDLFPVLSLAELHQALGSMRSKALPTELYWEDGVPVHTLTVPDTLIATIHIQFHLPYLDFPGLVKQFLQSLQHNRAADALNQEILEAWENLANAPPANSGNSDTSIADFLFLPALELLPIFGTSSVSPKRWGPAAESVLHSLSIKPFVEPVFVPEVQENPAHSTYVPASDRLRPSPEQLSGKIPMPICARPIPWPSSTVYREGAPLPPSEAKNEGPVSQNSSSFESAPFSHGMEVSFSFSPSNAARAAEFVASLLSQSGPAHLTPLFRDRALLRALLHSSPPPLSPMSATLAAAASGGAGNYLQYFFFGEGFSKLRKLLGEAAPEVAEGLFAHHLCSLARRVFVVNIIPTNGSSETPSSNVHAVIASRGGEAEKAARWVLKEVLDALETSSKQKLKPLGPPPAQLGLRLVKKNGLLEKGSSPFSSTLMKNDLIPFRETATKAVESEKEPTFSIETIYKQVDLQLTLKYNQSPLNHLATPPTAIPSSSNNPNPSAPPNAIMPHNTKFLSVTLSLPGKLPFIERHPTDDALSSLTVAFPCPDTEFTMDYMRLQLLGILLKDEIVGLVRDGSAYYAHTGVSSSFFYLQTGADSAVHRHLDGLLGLCLACQQGELFDDDDIKEAKVQLLISFFARDAVEMDSKSSFMRQFRQNLPADWLEQYREALLAPDSVTKLDFARLAKKYLNKDNAAIITFGIGQ